MAYNGTGTFKRDYNWTTDAGNGINIEPVRMDGEDDGFATGLSNAITKDGQTTITANIPFNSKKITGLANGSARTDSIALGQVQDGTYKTLGTLGGSADTYTAAPTPAITAYATGSEFNLKVNADNTGASTLNVSAVAAKNIKKYDGAGSKLDLEAGDLQQDQYYKVIYDGNDFVLVNPEIIDNLKSNNLTINNLTINNKLNTQPNSSTISSGAIAYTGAYMVVDTEGGASSDTLDTISGGTAGDRLLLRGATSNQDIVISDNTGNIQTVNNLDITIEPLHGDAVEFYYDGSNWRQVAKRIHSDFLNSKATNGYTYLPNGLILQWMTVSSTNDANENFSFPIAFPNNAFCAVTNSASSSATNDYKIAGLTTSQITLNRADGISGSNNVYIFVIGN